MAEATQEDLVLTDGTENVSYALSEGIVTAVDDEQSSEPQESEEPAAPSEPAAPEEAPAEEGGEGAEAPAEPGAVAPSEPSLSEELAMLRDTFTSEKHELAKALETAEDRIERMTAQAEEREEIISGLEAELETAKQTVNEIKQKLANPAFKAAVDGEAEAAEDGGDATSSVTILDQLLAIKDPKEKTKFRREHAEEIKEAQRELAGKGDR